MQAKYDKNAYEPDSPAAAFTRKREVIVGRAAMSGFVAALLGELLTGRGALGQLQLGAGLCCSRKPHQMYACLRNRQPLVNCLLVYSTLCSS